MEILHKSNIFIHVIAGTFALIVAIIAIISNKRKIFHQKVGKVFLGLLSIVIFTGLLGVFVFGRNSFLLVITVLSGYLGFSGYRVLQTKSNEPRMLDIIVALLSISTVFYFLYYFKTIGMIWNPVVIYSTVGTIIAIISYDFLRYFIPKSKYQKLWFYEHIYKMIGAFSALLSAFSGTVLYMYKPYSQILPSVFGTLLQIGFIVYYYRKFSKQTFVNSQESKSIIKR
jgi:hypothetical protein